MAQVKYIQDKEYNWLQAGEKGIEKLHSIRGMYMKNVHDYFHNRKKR